MKHLFWLLLAIVLVSCQPQNAKTTVYILDGETLTSLQTELLTPASILTQAGITLSPGDKILFNGVELPADFSLPPGGTYTLQIRRALTLTLITPDRQQTFQTTANTFGQALSQHGYQLFAQDFVEPPIQTTLISDITVTIRTARDLTVRVDGKSIKVKSSAQTVGQALASAGIPLLGLDYSHPGESEALPADGHIKVIRVTETTSLLEKPIPYQTEYQTSTELEVGTQNLIQAGETGLAISRVRVRYEDGAEVARVTENETMIRPPQNRIISQGTKVATHVLDLPGSQLQYWRSIQMYATSYSPCRLGIPGVCHTGTASGLPTKKGVVAMIRAWYNALQGTQVYIPGYGVAVVADIGAGFPDGRAWIDLGYSDDDWETWSGWVTVYFLLPAPATIPAGLQ